MLDKVWATRGLHCHSLLDEEADWIMWLIQKLRESRVLGCFWAKRCQDICKNYGVIEIRCPDVAEPNDTNKRQKLQIWIKQQILQASGSRPKLWPRQIKTPRDKESKEFASNVWTNMCKILFQKWLFLLQNRWRQIMQDLWKMLIKPRHK